MLPDLPEELLQQIFANFEVPGANETVVGNRLLLRKTLAAVCRANKQCCRLARPILFHTVHLNGGSQISIRAFWELLVQKPHLATLVRSLHIDHWEFPRDKDEDDESADKLESTAEVSEALQDATKSAMEPLERILGPAYKMALSRQLDGIEDGMLAYIIASCEKLNCLDLVVPHMFAESSCVYRALGWLAHLARTNGRTVGTKQITRNLPHLEELVMQHWDTENAFKISDAIPFWTFRNLRTFRADKVTCERDYGLRDVSILKATNIRELDLYDAIIEADVLRILLPHFPKLEILSIHWGSATVGDCAIDHQLLGEALRHHPHIAKNLKKLVLNPIDGFDYEHFDGDFSAPIGSLKSFQSLQHLGMTPRGLLGEGDEDGDNYPNFESLSLTEMLPESLRTLDVLTEVYYQSGDASNSISRKMVPFDTQLYALMSDDLFSELSTIKMNYLINETETTLKDIGWERIVHQTLPYGEKEYMLRRVVDQFGDI